LADPINPSKTIASWLGWGLAGIIVIGVIAGTSSSPPAPQTEPISSTSVQPVQALQPEAVSIPVVEAKASARAAKHLKLALDTEGFAGAMIYSQSCFRSLELKFSWAKLDQCASFDALAQLAGSEAAELGPEQTYFEKAACDQRFTNWAARYNAGTDAARAHLAELTQLAYSKISNLQEEDKSAIESAAADRDDDISSAMNALANSQVSGTEDTGLELNELDDNVE
jgi:hypothetical protein